MIMISCRGFELCMGLVFEGSEFFYGLSLFCRLCFDTFCLILMYLKSSVCLYMHWLMILQDVLNSVAGQNKSRLMFPNLSMLDISNNQLREIPHNIHELSNLSVLNISGNLGELLLEFICIIFSVFGR